MGYDFLYSLLPSGEGVPIAIGTDEGRANDLENLFLFSFFLI